MAKLLKDHKFRGIQTVSSLLDVMLDCRDDSRGLVEENKQLIKERDKLLLERVELLMERDRLFAKIGFRWPMKVINTGSGTTWTYDKVCKLYNKLSHLPLKHISCNIVAFTALLLDVGATQNFKPVTKMAILKTGYYADLLVSGEWFEVHVNKRHKGNELKFII